MVCEGHTRTLRHCCIRHTQTNIETTQATHANCRAVDAGTRKSSVRRGVDQHHGIMIFHLRLSVGVASGKNTPLSRSVFGGNRHTKRTNNVCTHQFVEDESFLTSAMAPFILFKSRNSGVVISAQCSYTYGASARLSSYHVIQGKKLLG